MQQLILRILCEDNLKRVDAAAEALALRTRARAAALAQVDRCCSVQLILFVVRLLIGLLRVGVARICFRAVRNVVWIQFLARGSGERRCPLLWIVNIEERGAALVPSLRYRTRRFNPDLINSWRVWSEM